MATSHFWSHPILTRHSKPTLRVVRRSLLVAALLFLSFATRPALAQTPADSTTVADAAVAGSAPQVVLMEFAANTTEAQRLARIAALGGELLSWMPQIQIAEVRLPQHTAQIATAGIAALNAPELLFVEPDLPVMGMGSYNDPAFASPAISYAFGRIQAADAWQITTGSEQVVIAVIDSGVRLDHPEFAARLTPGYDFVNDDDLPDDDSGHGTHVAGLIGAALNNGQGLAGVCPGCRLMPIKVLNAGNTGVWSDLAQGIVFATDNGARILNLSLGSFNSSWTLEKALAYARQRGVLIVAAAGNQGLQLPYYPAASEGVIAVGATDAQDGWWPVSNYGAFVDLTAPGDLIYSTYHRFDNPYSGYTIMSGTSMATAQVSGLAGLILSLYPRLTPGEVTAALLAGADDLGTAGPDVFYGQGRINAAHTLTLLTETIPTANGGSVAGRVFLPAIQSQ
ncbi:MAG: S8 family serine peptidase [Caldilineaceae bacterium]|nr:S8 family serine peptidase [Caldilineaceae bacterium]